MNKKKLLYAALGLTVLAVLFAKRRPIREAIASMTESGKYDYFSRFIPKNGGVFKTNPNEKNLVGIRTSTNTNTNEGKGAYDDLFVLIWKDAAGNKRVVEYPGNTEPSAFYRGKMGVDVNKDGKLDQGRLIPGFFEYVPDISKQLGNILRPIKDSLVERDVNQDGLFNDAATSGGGGTMLIHTGGKTNVVSAGCQTMPPEHFQRFLKDVHSGGIPGTVGYTLVDVARAVSV